MSPVTPRSSGRVGRRGARRPGGSFGTRRAEVPQDDGPVLAIDLGGTKASFAVIDAGRHRARPASKRPSHEGGPPLRFEALARSAAETVRRRRSRLERRARGRRRRAGIYDPATGRAWAPNLWGRDEVPLRDALSPAPARAARHRLRPLGLRPRRGVAGSGPRRDATSSSSPWAPASAPASSPTAGSSAASGGIAGAVGWFALDPRWREDYGARRLLRGRGGRPRRSPGASAAPRPRRSRRRPAAATPRPRRAVDETVEWLAMGDRQPHQRAQPAGRRAGRRPDAGRRPLPRAHPRGRAPVGAAHRRRRGAASSRRQLGEDAGLLGAARLALLGETT